MDINMQVIMKVPGPCKAWLEERYVWDIPARTEKEKKNQESKNAWRDEFKESINDVQYSELCLCWDINNKFATVSGNPYSRVLSLYKEVNIDKKHEALIDFWGNFGPLVKGELMLEENIKIMPIRKITNYLNFFNNIVGLWKTIKSERESILRGFFMNQKRLTHKQYDEIASMFNGPPKFYRMYGDEILSEYGSYTWDDDFYYLRLKAPLPLDSANIMAYSKDILKTNLQRILGKTINGSAELRIGTFGKFPLKIAPRDMMAAALLSFYCEEVIPNKTNMKCKCGCGENVSNGSEFFNRKHYLQWYKENTPSGIKEKALSKYRTRLNNGRITSGQYNDIKIYADKVLEQIKNKDIEQIKELFPQKIDSYWAKKNTPTSTPT